MARKEKNSRIKFLPPHFQIKLRESQQFDLPAKMRTSSDGRNPPTPFVFKTEDKIDFVQQRMWKVFDGTTGLVAAYRFNKQSDIENGFVYPLNSGSFQRKITFTGANAHPGRATPYPFEQNGYSLFLSSSTYGVINDPTNAFSFGDGGGSDVAFSISMWFRPEIYMHSSTSTILIGKFNNAGTTIEWYIQRTANQIYLYLFNGVNYIAGYSTNGIFTEGDWHHLVVTYAGTSVASGIKIYRNGRPVAMSTTSGGSYSFMVPNVANTVKICEFNGAERFNGHIDHLMVWRNMELTEADAMFLFKSLASEGGVQAVTKLPDGSLYNQYELRTDLVYNAGIPVRGFSDGLIRKNFRQTPATETIPAYKASDRPQIDGMRGGSRQDFFASGSAPSIAGPGFTAPLWSKTFIEIDLSTPTPSQFGIKRVSGDDYSMAYYDFNTKSYVGVGSRKRVAEYGSDPLTKYMKEKAIGFFGSYEEDYAVVDMPEFAGKKGDTFGFPYSEQYYVERSSSCLYPLSNILSEPFLLEKIVLQFSGSFRNNGYSFPQTTGGPIDHTITKIWETVSTFFILNQASSGYLSESLSVRYQPDKSTRGTATIHNSGSMDLVTYLQILCVSASTQERSTSYFSKLVADFDKVIDFNGVSTTSSSFGYDGKFLISGSVRIPTPTEYPGIYSFPDESFTGYYVLKGDKSNRNGRSKVCGRNWKSNFIGKVPASQSYSQLYTEYVSTPTTKYQQVPYVLLPTDNLIFGWQVPESGLHKISDSNLKLWSPTENTGPTLYFSGSAKVILFGSHIRVSDDGEYIEEHDTLNQLLSSVSVHEVIG